MAFACPACGRPQADGEHLAHHVALTASLHDDEHREWLDGAVPDWADRTPASLAAELVEAAEETEYPSLDPSSGGTAGGG